MGGHFAEVGVGVVEEGTHGFVGRGLSAATEIFGLQLSAARAVGSRHPSVLSVERGVLSVIVEVASCRCLGEQADGQGHHGEE